MDDPAPIILALPTDHQVSGGLITSMASGALAAGGSVPARGRRRKPLGALLTALAVLLLAGLRAWVLVRGNGNPHPVAAPTSLGTAASSTPRSVPVALPPANVPSTSGPPPSTTEQRSSSHLATAGATAAAPSSARAAGTSLSRPPAPPDPTTSPAARTSISTTTRPAAGPTSAQLAAAITDYYALLPGDTDQGWARLTGNFQNGTAQNRQHYQRFWDGIGRVVATDVHGGSPDTAEATITYYFKDGRTAVEPTVYSLVRQGSVLEIDSSTVLSSTTQ